MKLRVTFELPLPEGFEPFLQVIAEAHGYTMEEDKTAMQYICQNVCCPQVSALFQTLITSALHPYFGMAGRDQINAVQANYVENHTVSAEIVDE